MTQQQRILRHLKTFGSITSIDAFKDYGITRLSAVIYALKSQGHDIDAIRVCSKNRYGEPVSFCKYTLSDRGAA